MKQKNKTTQNNIVSLNEEDLFLRVSSLIEEGRKQVAKAINTAMVYTYYGVGQYIVEYEQGGNTRAEYGKGVLKRLSARLTERYGDGWSVETLTNCRKFFSVYQKPSTLFTKSENKEIVNTVCEIHEFKLSWSHYLILMREVNPQARSFYEIEAHKEANIYAQQYALCLPEKDVLQKKLSEWVQEYEMLNGKETGV